MIINHAKIVLENEVVDDGYLLLRNGKIIEIGRSPLNIPSSEEILDAKGLIVMPGFIDIHVHGSAGIDFLEADEDGIRTISQSLYNEGVTSYLATSETCSKEKMMRMCRVVKNAIKDNPSLCGIHMEGPYISLKYKGAQNDEFIRNPNINEFDEFFNESNHLVKYITLAPELPDSDAFIKHLVDEGIVCSAGHTDATFKDVERAIKNGLTNITHTHNAMSPYHHRNPGVVNAAMYFDCLYTEMICDKIHVCPETLKTFYKIVGPDRFIIITDALLVKNTDIEEFNFCGLECVKKDGAAYLKSGPLAGSILTMEQGVKNMREVANLSLCELAKISSGNAAKALKLSDRGSIKEGKLADLVLLDSNLNVKQVYKLGKRVK